MDIKMIKGILAQYRDLQGDCAVYRAVSLRGDEDAIPPALRRRVAVIDAWLRLLPDEEWFVVTKHLIDLLSWPLVLKEYVARWGVELERDERTLKRFQARALRRIACNVDRLMLADEIETLFGGD